MKTKMNKNLLRKRKNKKNGEEMKIKTKGKWEYKSGYGIEMEINS